MDITKQLQELEKPPVHETVETLAKRIAQQTEEAEARVLAKEPAPDQRINEEYVFDFEWKDGRGKVWSGRFKNRILTIVQHQGIGALQATWTAGQPYESLDHLTRNINLALAHMGTSLDMEMRPKWAKDLRSLTDYNLVLALYQEVANHEAIFHGRQPIEGGGQKGN